MFNVNLVNFFGDVIMMTSLKWLQNWFLAKSQLKFGLKI